MSTVLNLFDAPVETVIVITTTDIPIERGSVFEKIPELAAPAVGCAKLLNRGTMLIKHKNGRCFIFFRPYSLKPMVKDVGVVLFEELVKKLIEAGNELIKN